MNRALILLACSTLAGCFPYIPGQWDDYAPPPAETRIVASMTQADLAGDYWDADATSGAVGYVGFIEEPESGLSPLDLLAKTSDGCESADITSDQLDMIERFEDVGDEEVAVNGPDDLDFELDDTVYRGEFEDGVSDGIYQLTGGGYGVENFITMPALPAFDGPDMDGDAPIEIDDDELEFSWTPDESFDYVWITADAVEGTTNRDTVRCLVPAAAGSVEVDVDDAAGISNADLWIVQIGAVKLSEQKIIGYEAGASRAAGVHAQVGAFYRSGN
jgi:hypothetical protein